MDITNQDGEVMDTLVDTHEGQSSSAPATAEGVSEPSILVKACQCLESNGKFLTEEAKMHMSRPDLKPRPVLKPVSPF